MNDRDADEVGYDVAPEPGRVATVGSAARGPGVVGYRSANADVKGAGDAETLKGLTIPLWLLGCGVAVETVAAFLQERGGQAALMRVGVDLVAGTVLMLVGILLAARWRGIALGAFWNVVLKLAAVSVAPVAAVTLAGPFLRHVPLGGLLGWAAELVFYFALIGMLFDLDESDTWYCVWVIFLVRLAVYFSLLAWAH